MLNPCDDAFLDRLRAEVPEGTLAEPDAGHLEEPRGRWRGQAGAVARQGCEADDADEARRRVVGEDHVGGGSVAEDDAFGRGDFDEDAVGGKIAPIRSAHDVMPLAWAGESCRLIEARGIYPPDDTHTMDSAYLDAMRPLAEQRVRQAAWRLAQLLNQTIGAQAAP